MRLVAVVAMFCCLTYSKSEKHALKMVLSNSIRHVSCSCRPRPLTHPAPITTRGAGWSVALSHGLDREHGEDAKQNEDRRSDVQERIIPTRQPKDEPGKHRCHRVRQRVSDIDDAHVLCSVLC